MRGMASDAAMRDAAVQLVPAARGPRAAAHGPGLQRGGVRPPAVRRAPRAVPEGRQARGSSTDGTARIPARSCSSARRWRVALGLLGLQRGRQQADRHRHDAHPVRRADGPGVSDPEWIRLRQAIRQANRSAGAIFEFLERKPELHQDVRASSSSRPRTGSRSRT